MSGDQSQFIPFSVVLQEVATPDQYSVVSIYKWQIEIKNVLL